MDNEPSEAQHCEVVEACGREACGLADGTLYCEEHRVRAHDEAWDRVLYGAPRGTVLR